MDWCALSMTVALISLQHRRAQHATDDTDQKNALFTGSNEGAENWAMLPSLIEGCKLHRVNPQAYLTGALTRRAKYPARPHQEPQDLFSSTA
jgi:hypothetical protein